MMANSHQSFNASQVAEMFMNYDSDEDEEKIAFEADVDEIDS